VLRRIIRFALRQRLLIVGAALLLAVVGTRAYLSLDVEAFPDVEDVHVEIITLWPGHAAEEMERLVSLPVERQLNGIPLLSDIRSVSMFGLSDLTMTFADGTDENFVRQQTLERLQGANLPNGVQPVMQPLTNSLSEIYRYTLQGSLPRTEMKALDEWVVDPAYRSVSGVADVVSFGGQEKQYQVDVDPARMLAYGVSLPMVEQAVANANANAGGGFLEHGYERQVVRGVGVFQSVNDIADVTVTSRGGVPVRIADIGTAHIGGAPREGIVGKDSLDDVVEGIVLMRKGENALNVIKRIEDKTLEIQHFRLPAGARLVPFYERSNLINHTVHTVRENLVTGALLVILILMVFLGDIRSALVVATVIPFSLLIAFMLMDWQHVDANLISLGAVDFGLIVDAAVVMVEAYIVRFALTPPPTAEELERRHEAAPLEFREGVHNAHSHDFEHRASVEKRSLIAEITETMGHPMLFSVCCVVTAFVPIFTFQRVERRIFSPMAYTLTFTLLGSLLLSMTLIPVLASWLIKPKVGATPGEAEETRATKALHRVFAPMLEWALDHGHVVVGAAVGALAIALGLGATLGTEFIPELDEGNIWLTVTMPVGINIDQGKVYERQIRQVLMQYSQVTQLVTQIGRPDDGTDPKGPNNLEILADLKPRAQWHAFHENKDELIDDMSKKLGNLPGIDLNFSQYIKDNVEEALSGVKGELVVKIFGPDLAVLQEKANQTSQVLAGVRGVADLGVENQFGQPQMRFAIDRAAISRYGLNVSDVEDAITTAVGGNAVTQFQEGERLFDVRIRYVSEARSSANMLAALAVNTPDGRVVPLGQLAHQVSTEGASRISRELNERRIAIKCSVRGRDQGSWVDEAQRKVAASVVLPPGYRMTWGGQFENQRRATKRLEVIVPTSLVLIFILLFSAFGSMKYAGLIMVNLPFALIGGILMLFLRHINLSVSAAVGFVALFGIAVQNGIILVSEFIRLRRQGLPIDKVVRVGTTNRLRPVVMTASMAALGLLPAAFSTGVGAETTRPFASVIVGGLVTSTTLTLLLLPVLFRLWYAEPKDVSQLSA
jgi:heavy metal efflux system protein